MRRLLGTREGFDVYLGGGLAGEVTLGTIYRLGVDVHQLPQLVEEVVQPVLSAAQARANL